MINSMSLSFLLLAMLLASCVSGPSLEDRARWAEQKRVKAERETKATDALVALFMNEIWNRPVAELIAERNRGHHKIKTRLPFSRREVALSDMVLSDNFINRDKECNTNTANLADYIGLSVGTSFLKTDRSARAGISSAEPWEPGSYTSISVQLAFTYSGTREARPWAPNPPKCGYRNDFRQYNVLPTQLGWEVKNKLVSKGVPLIYCTKGISKHDRTLLPQHAKCTLNTVRQNGTNFDVTISSEETASYNSPLVFKFEFFLDDINDLQKTFAQIYAERFDDPKYLKRTLTRHNVYIRGQIGVREKNLGEIAAIEAEMAAEKQRSREAMAAAFGASIAEGAENLKNFRIGLADSQMPTLGLNDPKPQVDSKDVLVYVPNGEPTPALLNLRYQTWCAEQGRYYDAETKGCIEPPKRLRRRSSSYEAEKQNCLNAGKTWRADGGCNYANDVTVQGWSQGNTATVQRGDNSANSTGNGSPESSTDSSDGVNSRVQPSTPGNNLDAQKSAPNAGKKAEAYCWETKSKNYMCDGPLQKLLTSYSTLAKAQDMVDCRNATHIGDSWYDCNRALKSSERDVRELRRQ